MPPNGERVGLIVLAPGLVLGILGVYLSIYTVCPATGASCTHPYEVGGLPLEILGAILLVAGALTWSISFLRRPRPGPAQSPVDPDRLMVVPIGPAVGTAFTGGVLESMEVAAARRARPAQICSRCGNTLPEGASFCPECGNVVRE